MTEIRRLRPDEREALLGLLDAWPLGDGWRGRDFFRRYVEDDPTFSERNVWVAAEPGRLDSCAQIFPRPIRTPKGSLRMGGVGSVFTRPDRRGAGLATRVLRAAVADMRDRGLDVSILFASQISWYRQLGWELWGPGVISLYRREGAPGDSVNEASPFVPERDLAAVAEIQARYSQDLPGTVIRDPELWRASLACGGNPDEVFLLARRSGVPLAYVRAIQVDGVPTLSEWGRTRDGLPTLLALIDRVFSEGVPGRRAIDALQLPGLPDPELREALVTRGQRLETERPVLEPMLLCLAPESLSRRFVVSGDPQSVARAILPPERYFFWPSDRF